MLGELSAAEAEALLRSQRIAHLGVRSDERVYVFPVAYGYDGRFVYVVSHAGLKVALLRAHPEACLQVDRIHSPADWRSVLVHGTYEELHEEADRDAALAAIAGQGDTPQPASLAPYLGGPAEMVVYRLRVTEQTGRYERSQPLVLGHPPPPPADA
jgi:uncharacterized protein